MHRLLTSNNFPDSGFGYIMDWDAYSCQDFSDVVHLCRIHVQSGKGETVPKAAELGTTAAHRPNENLCLQWLGNSGATAALVVASGLAVGQPSPYLCYNLCHSSNYKVNALTAAATQLRPTNTPQEHYEPSCGHREGYGR